MKQQRIPIYKILYPLAFLYELGVRIRNCMFNHNVLHSQSFPLPVICIGNLTVGGTGKTPHTEYLIRMLLKENLRVGVLSRGYKRTSKGFVWATSETTMPQIGDEPYQMKSKFPSVLLAVDANRCHGISCMISGNEHPVPDVILLDDAYQHRYVKPGINILLTDYNRPIYKDAMLPAGRLREPLSGKKRANIMIVSKCPSDLSRDEAGLIIEKLSPEHGQSIYFTTLLYGNLTMVHKEYASDTQAAERPLSSLCKDEHVILLTGIATPEKLIHDISIYTDNIQSVRFADHHQFTEKEVKNLNALFERSGTDSIVITTEKDATRLMSLPLSKELKSHLYTLPIEVKILFEKEHEFNNQILNYVRTDSRNNSLSE